MTQKFNKTSLNVDRAAEREIVHRDYLAHTLRWSHTLRHVKKGVRKLNILDIGCGEHLPLLKMLYTNKRLGYVNYVGVDIRKVKTDFSLGSYDDTYTLVQADVSDIIPTLFNDDGSLMFKDGWDIIVCFEVLEHMPKEEGVMTLENIRAQMSPHTKLFISTPCFNGKAASNHVYEWQYGELKIQLESMFELVTHYGTFASQRDIEPVMSPKHGMVYQELKTYYDSNVLSVIFAPLYPAQSRNVFWHLKADVKRGMWYSDYTKRLHPFH